MLFDCTCQPSCASVLTSSSSAVNTQLCSSYRSCCRPCNTPALCVGLRASAGGASRHCNSFEQASRLPSFRHCGRFVSAIITRRHRMGGRDSRMRRTAARWWTAGQQRTGCRPSGQRSGSSCGRTPSGGRYWAPRQSLRGRCWRTSRHAPCPAAPLQQPSCDDYAAADGGCACGSSGRVCAVS